MVFGEYDDTKPLVFDISEDTPMGGTPPLPSPEWGTYYNGVGAAVLNAARATSGGMVTCGTSSAEDFPLTNGTTEPPLGGKDAFYSRFTDQYHMLFTSYIGGINSDVAYGVAERNGVVVVTGTTKNAGGIDFDAPSGGFMDDDEGTDPGNNWGSSDGTCWLARFDPAGVRDWMTLFGPKYALKPVNVDFDQSGNVYVAGTVIWQLGMGPLPVELVNSPTFNSLPICGGGYSQSTMGYAYWSPSPPDWTDGFLAKFTSALALERSTLFGGSSRLDHITDKEVERADGTMFIVGNTLSPLGTDPLCGPADGNTPGFPWCPSVLPDAFFMTNTPPDNHYEGVETGYLAMIKSTGQLLYCTSLGCVDEPDAAYAVTVANGRVTVVGSHSCEDYSAGCDPPLNGLPQCNVENDFTWSLTPNSNNDHFYIEQIRLNTLELVWSSTLGAAEVGDVSADATGKVYVTGIGTADNDLPLMPNPDYYSSILPGTGEGTYALGFDAQGQFWGTQYGDHLTPFAVASRSLDRIYVAGERGDYGFVPYHCPGTVDPWCVDNAAISGICYSQLKFTLPVGQEEFSVPGLSDLWVYPNPSQGQVIVTGLGKKTSSCAWQLTDAVGRLVTSGNAVVQDGKASLTFPKIATGAYHLLIQTQAGAHRPIAILLGR